MDAVAPYDFAPAVRLMLMGIAVALGPLAWIWLRHGRASTARRLHALTVLTLFLTFDLVLFGAFTRLTDSGLGCPDWPGCYGAASPIGAREDIRAAETAQPHGPVTHGKAWIEMIHRYFATGVGVLILTLAAATTVQWQRARQRIGRAPEPSRGWQGPAGEAPLSPLWPIATLVWVCVQGAFGAWTVTMKLFPAIVTLHLLGGMLLLALLTVQAQRYRHAFGGEVSMRTEPGAGPGRGVIAAVLTLVVLQIALGGWVSTNYAVLACTDFPTCHGRWWPQMDWAQAFQIWRELGRTGAGDYLSFQALTAIHMAHRLMAVAVLVALWGLSAWMLRRDGPRRAAWLIAALALWQLASGVSNVVLGWPLLAAVAHTGGAAALVVVLTGLLAQPAPEAARWER